MDQNSILGLINDNVYGIWFLVGAALVFFMQCGFAMVEAGFTRAKNAGNIIMKNLMDFLSRHSGIHSDRFRSAVRRRSGRHHRQARFRHFLGLCKL